MTRHVWWAVFCGVIIVLFAGGVRMSFGVFLRPLTIDLGVGREVFGFVVAIQALILGVAQPVAGLLADRYGSFRIIILGAWVYGLGLWMAALAASAMGLLMSLGVMVGLGLSGATQVVVLGAVGKMVPAANRSLVFGTVIAASSLGMFIFVPGAQALTDAVGWRDALIIIAIVIALLPIVALGLRGDVAAVVAGPKQSIREALVEAKSHPSYLLLTAGFFVCGFHVTFIGTHLTAFLVDNAVSSSVAAWSLGLIGLFNIIGAYFFGALGDRYSKKNLLTFLYLGRAVLMAAVLVVPINDVTALIFGAVMGVLWLATVPLTSSIVAQVFGLRYFSMLFGVVFMGHQFGSFAGAWLGGLIYDMTGSYDLMWVAACVLGLVASALHWPINEQPLARLETSPT
jgi:MFS family permease